MNREHYQHAMDRLDAMRAENRKLSAALSTESLRLTALQDDIHALLYTLTSDAAKDFQPIIQMAINGFMRLHPEVVPK